MVIWSRGEIVAEEGKDKMVWEEEESTSPKSETEHCLELDWGSVSFFPHHHHHPTPPPTARVMSLLTLKSHNGCSSFENIISCWCEDQQRTPSIPLSWFPPPPHPQHGPSQILNGGYILDVDRLIMQQQCVLPLPQQLAGLCGHGTVKPSIRKEEAEGLWATTGARLAWKVSTL